MKIGATDRRLRVEGTSEMASARSRAIESGLSIPVTPLHQPRTPLWCFDYAQLDTSTADVLHRAANQIRSYQRSVARTIISVGAVLVDVKTRLDHGQFGLWIRAEFDWSERTAQNYMRAAEVFGSKSETVADLPPAFIYKLAAPSTPTNIRDKVVADLEAGHPVDCRAVTTKIEQSRSHGLLDKLESTNGAAQEAIAILATIPIAQQKKLLRLLRLPGVLNRVHEGSLSGKAVADAPTREWPELPHFLDRQKRHGDLTG